jgi:hypothetical protein
MNDRGFFGRVRATLRAEWIQLRTLDVTARGWQLPLATALCSGLPLLLGAYFDHLDYGLTAALGGLVFLYTSNTPLHHRMVVLMASGFGMTACYAVGVMSHFIPQVMVLVLTCMVMLVGMVTRFYRLGAPGTLFFIMAAMIGAYSPIDLPNVPLFIGLFTMGALLACLIAFVYSAYILRKQEAQPMAPLPPVDFDFVVVDSIVIGLFVGGSLALSQALTLDRPYWVPISCLAVLQGASLRSVWNRKVHRILGTCAGLLLFCVIVALPLDKWSIVAVMMILSFIIETLVIQHYGAAVTFITPLTILMAEAAHLGDGATGGLMRARLLDTAIGSAIGLAGGLCLHAPRFRAVIGPAIRRLIPSRHQRQAL